MRPYFTSQKCAVALLWLVHCYPTQVVPLRRADATSDVLVDAEISSDTAVAPEASSDVLVLDGASEASAETSIEASAEASTDACVPQCVGRTCGSNGCGGSCGECVLGSMCNTNGRCEAGCSEGGTCALPDVPCLQGTIRCVGGMPRCERPYVASPENSECRGGTRTGRCNSSGQCVTQRTDRLCAELPSTDAECSIVWIPGGTFARGMEGPPSRNNSPYLTGPVRDAITVSGFWLDATEVSVGRFRRFWTRRAELAAGNVRYPGGQMRSIVAGSTLEEPSTSGTPWRNPSAMPEWERHPMRGISWDHAMALCAFDGGRLTTETEFEYAARARPLPGADGLPRNFPWGNDVPTCSRAIYFGCPFENGLPTRPVDWPNALVGGLYHLAGNAGEFQADSLYFIGENVECWSVSGTTDPLCTAATEQRRPMRGGGFSNQSFAGFSSAQDPLLSACRWSWTDRPNQQNPDPGIRCARAP